METGGLRALLVALFVSKFAALVSVRTLMVLAVVVVLVVVLLLMASVLVVVTFVVVLFVVAVIALVVVVVRFVPLIAFLAMLGVMLGLVFVASALLMMAVLGLLVLGAGGLQVGPCRLLQPGDSGRCRRRLHILFTFLIQVARLRAYHYARYCFYQ